MTIQNILRSTPNTILFEPRSKLPFHYWVCSMDFVFERGLLQQWFAGVAELPVFWSSSVDKEFDWRQGQ